MPWDAETFAKHNHSLSPSQSGQAAKVANAILREGGSEGKAIRIANWRAKRKKMVSKQPTTVGELMDYG